MHKRVGRVGHGVGLPSHHRDDVRHSLGRHQMLRNAASKQIYAAILGGLFSGLLAFKTQSDTRIWTDRDRETAIYIDRLTDRDRPRQTEKLTDTYRDTDIQYTSCKDR